MILNDAAIISRCKGGMIEPFRPENVQPASIDVALFNSFRVFEPHDEGYIDLNEPADITKPVLRDRFVLHPGEFVLGATEEVVRMPDDLVARIEGKSSIGRLALAVHVTAGFIDPGFHGRVTLEMVNLNKLPIILRSGKLVAQLSFHTLVAPAERPYQGRYQGDMDVASSRYGDGPTCPICKRNGNENPGVYRGKTLGGTESWSCGHTIGK